MTSIQTTVPDRLGDQHRRRRASDTDRPERATPVAAIALAAAVAGSVLGGAATFGVSSLIGDRAAAEIAATAAEQQRWLDYGRQWEARYRQMNPGSR